MKFTSRLGEVGLTEERRQHIFTFHPDVKLHIQHFAKTLSKPDTVRRSKYDPKVLLFYSELRKNKYLAIVMKTNQRNFILTAYTTNKITHLPL